MKDESVTKSLEKSKNVLEEMRKIVKQKICIKKTHTFTIIAMNFIQEQLNHLFFVSHTVVVLEDFLGDICYFLSTAR